jgi:hypothetical protein
MRTIKTVSLARRLMYRREPFKHALDKSKDKSKKRRQK